MMTKLEDFLCRRFKISLVSRQDTIKNSAGLLEACDILFGAEAKMRFDLNGSSAMRFALINFRVLFC